MHQPGWCLDSDPRVSGPSAAAQQAAWGASLGLPGYAGLPSSLLSQPTGLATRQMVVPKALSGASADALSDVFLLESAHTAQRPGPGRHRRTASDSLAHDLTSARALPGLSGPLPHSIDEVLDPDFLPLDDEQVLSLFLDLASSRQVACVGAGDDSQSHAWPVGLPPAWSGESLFAPSPPALPAAGQPPRYASGRVVPLPQQLMQSPPAAGKSAAAAAQGLPAGGATHGGLPPAFPLHPPPPLPLFSPFPPPPWPADAGLAPPLFTRPAPAQPQPQPRHSAPSAMHARTSSEGGELEDTCGGGGSGGAAGCDGKQRRILANRQSAQRSRLRKMQHCVDLEASLVQLTQELGLARQRLVHALALRDQAHQRNAQLRSRATSLAAAMGADFWRGGFV